jgi:colanic acid biosynthesis glycosyl transferase WcaI
MRILILSQYYPPEPIPKAADLARELSQRGHVVSVLTGYPHYPFGRLYPGFRLGLFQRENLDGVPVVRAFEYPYHGKSVLGRIANYVSFMVSAPLASFLLPPCDVIYVRHPPLTIGLAAWAIARLRRVPFVYDVQDIWPDIALVSGLLKEGRLVRAMRKLERFVYRHADHLLAITDWGRENLISKGAAQEKVTILPNWAEETLFRPGDPQAAAEFRKRYGWGERFVVTFAGNLGLVQALDTALRAIQGLKKTEKILLALVGEGTDKSRLQELARSMGLENVVQFIEHQPVQKMPAILAASDALLVSLQKSELLHYAIPTKTLAYLASGKPLLVAAGGPTAKLVREAEAGLAVPPEDPDALAQAVRTLATMPRVEREAMGLRGRAYLLKYLSKGNVIGRYESLFKRMIRVNGRPLDFPSPLEATRVG